MQPRRRRTREVARGDEGEEREIESAVVGESALFCINLVLGIFVFGDTIHVYTPCVYCTATQTLKPLSSEPSEALAGQKIYPTTIIYPTLLPRPPTNHLIRNYPPRPPTFASKLLLPHTRLITKTPPIPANINRLYIHLPLSHILPINRKSPTPAHLHPLIPYPSHLDPQQRILISNPRPAVFSALESHHPAPPRKRTRAQPCS